jgi:putative mRNA 3-end processing factor
MFFPLPEKPPWGYYAMLEVTVDHGVTLQSYGKVIVLDPTRMPKKVPEVILISHGHSDHFSHRVLKAYPSVPKIMSKATREIIDPRERLSNVIYIGHGETVEVSGVNFSAYSAGHIIGSLQFSFNLGGKEIVFTGDFNLEKRLILRPAQIVKGDVLIIDATYGAPTYIFPPRNKLYREIVSIAKRHFEENTPVVFKGRSIGTAQELVALMNASLDALPLVEEDIARHNHIYEAHGEWLGAYAYWNGQAPNKPSPIITGLSSKNGGAFPRRICTGWARGKLGIPLSSHADLAQILRYIKESSASVVIPFCGFRKELATIAGKSIGIEALYRVKANINL